MRRKHKRKPAKPLPVQLAFIQWLARERHRLTLAPRLTTRGGAPVVYFEGVSHQVHCTLSGHDLSACAWHQGACWDVIWTTDFNAKRRGSGYVCADCEWGRQVSAVWPTLQAYWADHVFEPWLEWVNDELALSSHLTFQQLNGRGMTWATLKRICGPLLPPGRWRLSLSGEDDDGAGWVSTRTAYLGADSRDASSQA